MLYTEFMKDNIIIRNMQYDDIPQIVELQKITFSDLDSESIWKQHHLEAHLKIFRQGQFCAEHNEKIVGTCSSFITKIVPQYKAHTWLEACGDFLFKNHNPGGDTLYDADISIHPDFRRHRIATRLNDVRKKLVIKLNLRRMVIGGRLSNYYKYPKKLSALEYSKKVVEGTFSDPVLSFHLNNGFTFIKVLPNYLPDPHSMNFGTFMEWKNPRYEKFSL